eukprot:m.8825 g.8825  ORF g.8825 m.8825 type:complete len:2078 (-) comp5402_c0_seq1:291-6524(-)
MWAARLLLAVLALCLQAVWSQYTLVGGRYYALSGNQRFDNSKCLSGHMFYPSDYYEPTHLQSYLRAQITNPKDEEVWVGLYKADFSTWKSDSGEFTGDFSAFNIPWASDSVDLDGNPAPSIFEDAVVIRLDADYNMELSFVDSGRARKYLLCEQQYCTTTLKDGSCPTECAAGFGEDAQPTTSTDRTCRECDKGEASLMHETLGFRVCSSCFPSGYSVEPRQTHCIDHPLCTEPGFGESVPATNSTSRQCDKRCEVGQFSQIQDDDVRRCVTCHAGTFQNQPGQDSCRLYSTCDPGTYIEVDGTSSSDRVCDACDGISEYQNIPNSYDCKRVTECAGYSQQVQPPTPSTDAECQACIFGETYYENGFCRPVSSCPDGTVESEPPTITSDRVCVSESFVCTDMEREDNSEPCTCPENDICRSCFRQPTTEAKYGVILISANTHPRISEQLGSCKTFTTGDVLSSCSTYCQNTETCNSFSLQNNQCCLKSDYSTANGAYSFAGGEFYALSQCSVCETGYFSQHGKCVELATLPYISPIPTITVPVSMAVGTQLHQVLAATDQNGGTLRYALSPDTQFFEISSNGRLTSTAALQSAQLVSLTVTVTDSRTTCNYLKDSVFYSHDGGCVASAPIAIQVVSLLGCPNNIDAFLSQEVNKTVAWQQPRLPSFLRGYNITVDPRYADARGVFSLGTHTISYIVEPELTVGGNIQCIFTVTVQSGFLVYTPTVEVLAKSHSLLYFLVSSPHLSLGTATMPAFVSDLGANSLSIGVGTPNTVPYSVEVPTGYHVKFQLVLSWCSEGDLPATRPADAISIRTEFRYYGADGPSATTTDLLNGWMTADARCLQVMLETEPSTNNFAFESMAISVELNPGRRKRRDLTTYYPTENSFLALVAERVDGDVIDEAQVNILTLQDVSPPKWINCPPLDPISKQLDTPQPQVDIEWLTFDVEDNVAVISVSPSADLLSGGTFSLLGSPHTVELIASDEAGNTATCEFSVEIFYPSSTFTVETSPLPPFDFTQEVNEVFGVTSYAQDILSSVTAPKFQLDFSSYTEFSFAMTAPPGEPFYIQTNTVAHHGYIEVDLGFALASDTNPIPSRFASDASAAVKVEFHEYTPRDTNQTVAMVQQTMQAQILIDEMNNHVRIVGVSPSFSVGFSATKVVVKLMYPFSTVPTGEKEWALSPDSSVRVVYLHSSDTTAPKPFLALYDTVVPYFEGCPEGKTFESVVGSTSSSAAVVWPVFRAYDNRGVPSLTHSIASGSTFTLGLPSSLPTTITSVARDDFGNTATCTYFARVLDQTPPVLSECDVNVTAVLPSQSSAVEIAPSSWQPTVTDNSEGAGLPAPTITFPSGSLTLNYGTIKQRIDAQDAWGNTAVCYRFIEVRDETKPVLSCRNVQDATKTKSAIVHWDLPASDNSGQVTVTSTPPNNTEFELGVTTVVATATDPAGNIATCSFEVQVVSLTSDASGISSGGITGIAIAIAVLVLALLVLLLVMRRQRRKKPHNWAELFKLMEKFGDVFANAKVPLEIPRNSINLIAAEDGGNLGAGAFGVVTKATHKSGPQIPEYLVAVKSLKETAGGALRQEMLEEAALMAQFHSEYVVSLIGVVTIGDPVLVVIEYLELGSLKGYLQAHDVKEEILLQFAGDIAEGLEHIHSFGVIHRDVAARNVLVSSKKRCKISDFGLAREIDDDDSYYRSRGGQVPVRWTAVEALETRKYSEKTDVWSFGIVLYELWTRAEVPYKGWTNQKVWVEVTAGFRLSKPKGCSKSVFKQMETCWYASRDRPTFSYLRHKFRALFESYSRHALVSASDSQRGYVEVELAEDDTYSAGSDLDESRASEFYAVAQGRTSHSSVSESQRSISPFYSAAANGTTQRSPSPARKQKESQQSPTVPQRTSIRSKPIDASGGLYSNDTSISTEAKAERRMTLQNGTPMYDLGATLLSDPNGCYAQQALHLNFSLDDGDGAYEDPDADTLYPTEKGTDEESVEETSVELETSRSYMVPRYDAGVSDTPADSDGPVYEEPCAGTINDNGECVVYGDPDADMLVQDEDAAPYDEAVLASQAKTDRAYESFREGVTMSDVSVV